MSARIAEWPPIEAWITAPGPHGRDRIVESVVLRDGRVVPAETDPADLYPWWAPADGSLGCAVRDVVRAGLAVAVVLAVFALPGLVDMAMTALLGGGVR